MAFGVGMDFIFLHAEVRLFLSGLIDLSSHFGMQVRHVPAVFTLVNEPLGVGGQNLIVVKSSLTLVGKLFYQPGIEVLSAPKASP